MKKAWQCEPFPQNSGPNGTVWNEIADENPINASTSFVRAEPASRAVTGSYLARIDYFHSCARLQHQMKNKEKRRLIGWIIWRDGITLLA